jgi:hypothetical protein
MDLTLSHKEVGRKDILDFENVLKQQPNAFIGDNELCPLKHSFADEIYVREIMIPANIVLTGKVHKHSHPNFLMQGKVEVYTEFGGYEILEAPLSMISKAGTKRVVKTLSDTIWITIHSNPTNTQDLDELEKIVIAEDYNAYEKYKKLQERKRYLQSGIKLIKKFFTSKIK